MAHVKINPLEISKSRKAGMAIRSLAYFSVLSWCISAQATGRYSKFDLAFLPPYCADSELSSDYVRMGAKWQYWTARMGENFNRIHHYCQGLLNVAAARKLTAGSPGQQNLLRSAIAEYNFILGYPPEELQRFPLWPEMLTKRAEAAVLLQDWSLAYTSYEAARQVKPDYWPAYLGWAEVLVKINLKSKARDLLKEGLLITPEVQPMRDLYSKLGGSLAEIPNAVQKVSPPADPSSAPASSPEPASGAAAASAPVEPR